MAIRLIQKSIYCWLLCACLLGQLHAQRCDTTVMVQGNSMRWMEQMFHENDEVLQERFETHTSLEGMSMQARFMRNLPPEMDSLITQDSTLVYAPTTGQLLYALRATDYHQSESWAAYDSEGRVLFSDTLSKENLPFWVDEAQQLAVPIKAQRVEGRAGEEIRIAFWVKNNGNEEQKLTLQTNAAHIQLLTPDLKLLPHGISCVMMSIRLQQTPRADTIWLNSDFPLCIQSEVYDLKPEDFSPIADNAPTATGLVFRENLILKSGGDFQLLTIYNIEKERVATLPISKKITTISLDELPSGTYLLKLSNLGNGTHLYQWIDKS
ncbi:MAG: hypothetical protein R2795_00365 [Saprospiraceae bacterium]